MSDVVSVDGNPARQAGWVCACGRSLDLPLQGSAEAACPCGRVYRLDAAGVSEQV
jgi:hypothetical protein